MTAPSNESPLALSIAEAGRRLARLALDRDDLTRFAAAIPESNESLRVKVTYEMPLLRIVTVGWAIAYYLAEWREKDAVHQAYWSAVERFAQELTDVSALMVGEALGYFEVIRERAELYIECMADAADGGDPTSIIGPEFARTCDAEADIHVIMAGNRTFQSALLGTRAFLNAVTFISESDGPS